MIKIGKSSAKAIITAPLEAIDLGEWMFTLNAKDYAACAEGHQSAAQGLLPSGKRMSINVEYVAGYLMVQHYIETKAERDHVIGISPTTNWISDDVTVQTQITWELKASKLSDHTTELICTVIAETENEQFAHRAHEIMKDIPPSETPFQKHIEEETPLFAKDIERKALLGVWQ